MSDLRRLREHNGLTQGGLAERAGVSRQLVGAVEAGRHLPRVDAAIALAAVLDVDVAALFGVRETPVDVVTGEVPPDGAVVRSGRVGECTVTAPVRIGPDGWDVGDGSIDDGMFTSFGRRAAGLVVAGCEPGLEVLERMLREQGMAALAAPASSRVAVEAQTAGRVHAAVVHGSAGTAFRKPRGLDIERYHLATWRVGLAGPADASASWWRRAVTGKMPVAQRESGAAVQRTFEKALGPELSLVDGPRVATHLEAARHAVLAGIAGVTIEPAALAVGAIFHPLDVHDAQLWVDRAWLADRIVTEALDIIVGRRFQRRLQAVGGYDLARCGSRVG